jgi:hypothetical protein
MLVYNLYIIEMTSLYKEQVWMRILEGWIYEETFRHFFTLVGATFQRIESEH